jgi:hypothetical protein
MNILENIKGISNDSLRLIRVLLANTSLKVKVNGVDSDAFKSNIGSPQGDALSPILFSIYLEHAVRKLQGKVGLHRPDMDKKSGIPHNAIYADDTDFISLCNEYLGKIQAEVTSVFGELILVVNTDKTEHT